MKSTKFIYRISRFFLSILLVSVFPFNTYAQRTDFLLSAIVPAASGFVDIHIDNNKNYVIKVQVADLAEVKKLIPAKQTYVVWIITEQTITKNIGQINSLTGFFSKKPKESLETVSPFKPIKVFITTEYKSNVQYPSSEIILSTQLI